MPKSTQKTDSIQENRTQHTSPKTNAGTNKHKAKQRPITAKQTPIQRKKNHGRAAKKQHWQHEINEEIDLYYEERFDTGREDYFPDHSERPKKRKRRRKKKSTPPLKKPQSLIVKDVPPKIKKDTLPLPEVKINPAPASKNRRKEVSPIQLPGGDMGYERSAREINDGEKIFEQNRNYAITAISRLNQYLHTLDEAILKTHNSDPTLATLKMVAKEVKTAIENIHQDIHQAVQDVSLALSLNLSAPYTLKKQKAVTQTIDQRLAQLTTQANNFKNTWDGTIAALVAETQALIASKGQIHIGDKAEANGDSDQTLHKVYAPYRGREFRGLSQKNPEKKPGGQSSLKATLLEKSMSINAAAQQLYNLLMVSFSKDQIGFIQAIRLMSRPDTHKVETAFINVPDNTTNQTLREVLIKRYGMPNVDNDRKEGQRAKYLFELLDNGGKATNATRLAVSLGLMERGTWARFVSDEEEVVRLAELCDPHELEKLWNIYGATMQRSLNTYNYRRVKNFVISNTHYAAIKATAKAIGKEKDPEKKAALENKLGEWQANILRDKDGVSAFLTQKDQQLAAIVKNFSVGASKYVGRFGFSLPKTDGKVKDLAKAVEAWLKTIAKEEKTYFNNQPVIRRYISGQTVQFKPIGTFKDKDQNKEYEEINITPPSPTKYLQSIGEGQALLGKGFWGKLGGSIAAIFQYPAALATNILSLGRYTLFLSDNQKQQYRANKMGWNSGDRKFLRYMLEAGTANNDRQDDHPDTENRHEPAPTNSKKPDRKAYLPGLEEERIEGHQASDLKQIVNTVRHIIQTRGAEFEPEMLAALVNIARQADITYQGGGWDNKWNPLNAKRYKINRRQDLVKSLMKLPDRWKIQFLNAFLPKDQSLDKATDAQQANDRTDWALDWVRRVLIALRVAPKQIHEVVGSLRYGGDVSPTYLELRRYAGKESFSSHKVVTLAFQLNDKELKIAQTDKEMHVGLERQFAKHLKSSFLGISWKRKLGNKSIVERFNSLKAHLHIHPLLDWSNDGQNISKGSYKKLEKKTSHTLDKRIRKDISDGASDLNREENRLPDSGYKRYHLDYVESKDVNDDIGKEQTKRRDQQSDLDNLEGVKELSYKAYRAKVKTYAARFAQIIKNTSDYNKALQAALDVWQKGDEFVMSKVHFNANLTKWRNPNFRRDEHSYPTYARSLQQRKNIFFVEVYSNLLHSDFKAYRKFEKLTKFNYRQESSSRNVNTVTSMYGHDFDLINEILKSNYRWFRPASGRDKGGAGAAFTNLNGRVLLEEWTNVREHRDKIAHRTQLKEAIKNEKRQKEPNERRINDLETDYNKLNTLISNECIPMPRQDRLRQLKNAFPNDGAYMDMVRNLLLHLSNSAEFDKSFFDALKEKGYQSGDMVTLTEVYKYLASQEKEKFLTGGSMTTQWKALTVKSTERKEGAARLVSAMRELDSARDKGKIHSTIGENKGFFYDTYFDDVEERQEGYEKQAAKYRKNLGKMLWMLSTAAFVPFGAGLGIGSALAAKLVISAFFTGQGMAITLLNSVLDPYKHSIGGTFGETAWTGVKGALLSGVLMGGFELKTIFENMSWLGTESIDALESANVDNEASFFDRFTGNPEKRMELLGKKAGEYGMRKVYKEIGKEIIRGIDKGVREGPQAGLVNFKDVFNRAFIVEMFSKVMLKISLTDGATGVAPALDELFGAPDKPKDKYTNKDFADDFRGGELRRNVRRKLYEKLGFKHYTGMLEYAISNQNPAFRPFIVKYDVSRKMPTAQESVDYLKHKEEAEEALLHLEMKVNKVQSQLSKKKEEDVEDYTPDFTFLNRLISNIEQNAPEKLAALTSAISSTCVPQIDYIINILSGYQSEDVTTGVKNITLTDENGQEQTLLHRPTDLSGGRSKKKDTKPNKLAPKSKGRAPKNKTTTKRKKKKSSKTLSWFETNSIVNNDTPSEHLPSLFRVTNVSGNNNNCLVFSIATGIGRALTNQEALQIRDTIGVYHQGFLENNFNIVDKICTALGQSIEIRWWRQSSVSTVAPAGINFTYGTGPNSGRVVNVVEVGNNHFQLLSEI
ncbi:hypothetical protein [Microscilla marina]|uniref:Uncharacterized protein n=1 Tax=Microscilla marina ATCC 23134 TaxID=313606 RepID=A1ZQ95_MICM2|nr:hypothetical protein [Microscilla marina]EAY27504.1 hypothetical protein M23134_06905 [Microscilla marina ATCC 23134]